MNLRQIITDQDWSDAMKLRNSFHWNAPVSVDEAKAWHEIQRQEGPDGRYLLEKDGVPLVYVCSSKVTHDASGRSFRLSAFVNVDQPTALEYQDRGLAVAEEFALANGAKEYLFEARSDYSWMEDLMRSRGYAFDMRFPVSSLKVQEVEIGSEPLAGNEELISVAELRDRTPETWEHLMWRLEMDVAADLPLPFPFVESPFEAYQRDLADPTLDLNSQFLLLVDGYPAGITQMFRTPDPRFGSTGLTGVRREYRRRHIATKLKQHSARWCRERGIEEIYTDNEENNPMYQLNLQLGFRHRYDNLSYVKKLDA
jgi:GNAT superfamily N-acetyltransferase